MSSPAIYRFRRREIERRIEEFIALLDLIDGDHDLEDDEIEDIHVYAPASRLLAEEARK